MTAAGRVLPQGSPAGQVSARAVRRLLDGAVKSPALGEHFAVVVEELGADSPLVRLGGPAEVIPASLVKLLVAVAALSELGPEHRFETSVVRGASRHDVVLVGGGDPLLTDRVDSSGSASYPAEANLAELARATARRLEEDGVRRVRLGYDTSLFSGPAINPAWRSTYIRDSVVAPITALWIDAGRTPTGRGHLLLTDPALTAALRFATLLRSTGVAVSPQMSVGHAGRSAAQLAVVKSATLDQIVEEVLSVSDNAGAEVLLRQVALATGRQGSAVAGVRAVRETLSDLGIDLTEVTFYDGSGLARGDALSLDVLLDVLQLAAGPGHHDLRAAVSSLPVAGFSGTLAYRFARAPEGLGVVRAKTGTLSGVHGLAGLVSTREGQTLMFAAVADEVPVRRALAARAQLDRIAALLASCGCTPQRR